MRGFVLAMVCLLMATTAEAHTRSYSYSLWDLGTEPYQVTVRLNQYDLTRLDLHPDYTGNYSRQVADMVRTQLVPESGGSTCVLENESIRQAADGWVMMRATVDCTEQGDFRINSSLLLDAISSHMHFVTVRDASGGVREKVLTEADNHWFVESVDADIAGSPQTITSYWVLGIQHILTGWDHLAFVFGLLLLAGSLGQLAWLVTGFTIAHSLTLALAALGHVQPVTSAVEALIGLSILLVAIEYFWEHDGQTALLPALVCAALLLLAMVQPVGLPLLGILGIALFVACYFGILKNANHPVRWRLLIAFAFGLFHGFGFAGILAEMSLPDARLLPALFGFNLGVETGQLLVIVLLWPLLAMMNKKLPAKQWGATAIAGLGTFWFITRAFI